MKKLFWILLLANVLLFAVMQRGWLGWDDQEPQTQPALHEEMLQLLEPSQVAPIKPPPVSNHVAKPESAPVPVSAPPAPPKQVAPVALLVPQPAPSEQPATPAPTPKPQPSPAIATPAADKSDKLSCLEWGDFSGPDLARATAELSAMQLGDKLSRRQIEQDIGYWVYIPPLGSKAAIKRKIAELKALGIKEYFVVQTPRRWRNAVSLGVFKTREAAQHFLNHMASKGVRSAKVGERASKLKSTIFRLNRADAATESKLGAMQKEFPGSELKKVACTLTR